MPRLFRKCLGSCGNSRHFRNYLGISGNAWFPQFPATYIHNFLSFRFLFAIWLWQKGWQQSSWASKLRPIPGYKSKPLSCCTGKPIISLLYNDILKFSAINQSNILFQNPIWHHDKLTFSILFVLVVQKCMFLRKAASLHIKKQDRFWTGFMTAAYLFYTYKVWEGMTK